jgi:hypothetical protein
MPLMAATPALAAAPDTSPCKSGGFVNYVDPATGKPFANQGRCVASVNRVGSLVPVRVAEVKVYDLQFGTVDDPMGFTQYRLLVTGLKPGAELVLTTTIPVIGQDREVVDVWTTTVDENGEFAPSAFFSGGSCFEPLTIRLQSEGLDRTLVPSGEFCAGWTPPLPPVPAGLPFVGDPNYQGDPGTYRGSYVIPVDGLPPYSALRLWAWRGGDIGMEQDPVGSGAEGGQVTWTVGGQCDDPQGLWYKVSVIYGDNNITETLAPPPACL